VADSKKLEATLRICAYSRRVRCI